MGTCSGYIPQRSRFWDDYFLKYSSDWKTANVCFLQPFNLEGLMNHQRLLDDHAKKPKL